MIDEETEIKIKHFLYLQDRQREGILKMMKKLVR